MDIGRYEIIMMVQGIHLLFGLGLYYPFLIWNWVHFKKAVKPIANPIDLASLSRKDELLLSVIIPARNEEENIASCLFSLMDQTLPKHLWEVIVIDDESTDHTLSIAQKYALSNMTLLDRKDYPTWPIPFKKGALGIGISKSKGRYIVTTDADTWTDRNWLITIAQAIYAKPDGVCFSGPILYEDQKRRFSRTLCIEGLALVAMGGAGIQAGYPTLANGANLVYLKSAYQSVGGFQDIAQVASGDDELLLHKLAKAYPGRVSFIGSMDAVVYTRHVQTYRELLSQRRRWVSKSRVYKKPGLTLLLVGFYLYHFTLLLSLMISWRYLESLFLTSLVLLGLKTAFQYPLIHEATRHFQRKKWRWAAITRTLYHTIYIVFIGVAGNFGKYTWKGRKVA